MATTESREITLGATDDPSVLFATEADMDGVDVQASAERFDDLIEQRVREAYPDAIVRTERRTRAYGFDDEGAVLNHIADMVDDVIQSGDWLVTR